MALTNFGTLTEVPMKAWAKSTWQVARNMSFVMNLAGSGPNSVIQRITELSKSNRGTQAVMTLVADLANDGVTGDNVLKDNEEKIRAYDSIVQIDQLRNANRSAGRMAEQKQVVRFRNTSRDVLGYWLGDRIDQIALLALTGLATGSSALSVTTSGALRPVLAAGQNLTDLAFAGDCTVASGNRFLRWTSSGGGDLVAGDVTAVEAADTPTYAMLVEAKAHAKDHYIKGVKGPGGEEVYHVVMSPQAIAKLKLDADFKNAVNSGAVRGNANPVFSGSIPTVDGLVIHEHRHAFTNVKGATLTGAGDNGALGFKWGTFGAGNANVEGGSTLLLGAQALAMADLGDPDWVEESEDYGNQPGIAIGKLFGFKKSQFHSDYDGGVEDFGVLRIDHAI